VDEDSTSNLERRRCVTCGVDWVPHASLSSQQREKDAALKQLHQFDLVSAMNTLLDAHHQQHANPVLAGALFGAYRLLLGERQALGTEHLNRLELVQQLASVEQGLSGLSGLSAAVDRHRESRANESTLALAEETLRAVDGLSALVVRLKAALNDPFRDSTHSSGRRSKVLLSEIESVLMEAGMSAVAVGALGLDGEPVTSREAASDRVRKRKRERDQRSGE